MTLHVSHITHYLGIFRCRSLGAPLLLVSAFVSYSSAHSALSPSHLEDHLVGSLVAPQAEVGRKIGLQILLLLDIHHNRLIHLLLIFYPRRIRLLLLCSLALSKESLLPLPILFLPRPIFILAHAVQNLAIHTRNIDDGGCSDYVAVVYAAEGHAVGFEGAGDEEGALREVSEEDDAFSAVAA